MCGKREVGDDCLRPGPLTCESRIGGQPAFVEYVSPTQINAQVPFEVAPGVPVLKVTANGATSVPGSITIDTAAPGIFVVSANRAAVTNPDGSLNTTANPVKAGDAITIYFTGIGPIDNPVPTGAPAPLGGPLSRATLPVSRREFLAMSRARPVMPEPAINVE